MLTDKERRAVELQATKDLHRAAIAQPKVRKRLHKALVQIKAGNTTLSRCPKEERRKVIKKKLRLLRIKVDRAKAALAKYRGDIVIARLILKPRLAWKTNAKGVLSWILMPSDFAVRQRPLADLPSNLVLDDDDGYRSIRGL